MPIVALTKERVRSYRDLRVWTRSVELAVEVMEVTKRLPRREDYGLRGQMSRAAVSIPSNIAEGHGREHLGDYIHHLSIASGSLAELETQLHIAARLDLLPPDIMKPLLERSSEVSRMLASLIKSLRARSLTPRP
ncbi:MAG TPA: four helix bundle protein [Gemmatimonadaceae bacterium]|nr:four helix bundle protein [Gemmatimonadaceae bacterium]